MSNLPRYLPAALCLLAGCVGSTVHSRLVTLQEFAAVSGVAYVLPKAKLKTTFKLKAVFELDQKACAGNAERCTVLSSDPRFTVSEPALTVETFPNLQRVAIIETDPESVFIKADSAIELNSSLGLTSASSEHTSVVGGLLGVVPDILKSVAAIAAVAGTESGVQGAVLARNVLAGFQSDLNRCLGAIPECKIAIPVEKGAKDAKAYRPCADAGDLASGTMECGTPTPRGAIATALAKTEVDHKAYGSATKLSIQQAVMALLDRRKELDAAIAALDGEISAGASTLSFEQTITCSVEPDNNTTNTISLDSCEALVDARASLNGLRSAAGASPVKLPTFLLAFAPHALIAGLAPGTTSQSGIIYQIPVWATVTFQAKQDANVVSSLATVVPIPQWGPLMLAHVSDEISSGRKLVVSLDPNLGSVSKFQITQEALSVDALKSTAQDAAALTSLPDDIKTARLNAEKSRLEAETALLQARKALEEAKKSTDDSDK
jgi:hypothetical protein